MAEHKKEIAAKLEKPIPREDGYLYYAGGPAGMIDAVYRVPMKRKPRKAQ